MSRRSDLSPQAWFELLRKLDDLEAAIRAIKDTYQDAYDRAAGYSAAVEDCLANLEGAAARVERLTNGLEEGGEG